MIFLEIEDLIGNAFIPYLQNTGNHILPLRKIEEFGEKVIDSLYQKNDINASINFTKNCYDNFFDKYSDMFRCISNGTEAVVVLIDNNITSCDLSKKFSGYLSTDFILAFNDPNNTTVLFKE